MWNIYRCKRNLYYRSIEIEKKMELKFKFVQIFSEEKRILIVEEEKEMEDILYSEGLLSIKIKLKFNS